MVVKKKLYKKNIGYQTCYQTCCQTCDRREGESWKANEGGQQGKAQCVVLVGSCVMCGNGVATAVSTYAPLILSCCPAPWTAVPPNTHMQTRLQKASFICQWAKEGSCDSADEEGYDSLT